MTKTDDKPEPAKPRKGPRGGVPHTPGREHARKSAPAKKRRFEKNAARKARERYSTWYSMKQVWDRLEPSVKNMRPELDPGPEPKKPQGWTPP